MCLQKAGFEISRVGGEQTYDVNKLGDDANSKKSAMTGYQGADDSKVSSMHFRS
jgi:hypothetical protein